MRFSVFALSIAVVLAACHKTEPAALPRALDEPPPPPDIAVQQKPQKEGEEDDFKIAASRPQGKLVGAVHPTITFTEPVMALSTLEQGDPARGMKLDPPIKGRFHWLGSSSVEFLNDEPWPYATAFHLIVPAGFKALDGAKLDAPFQLDFTTPAPEALPYETQPSEHLCKWSAPEQQFRFVVNQPLAEPAKAFFLEVGERHERVPLKVVESAAVRDEKKSRPLPADALGFVDKRMRYVIAPAQKLPLDTDLWVGLDGDARSAEGALTAGQEYRLACHTSGPMKILRVEKCSAQEHCAQGPLAVVFSNPLGDVAELKKRLHLDAQVDDLDVEGDHTRVLLQGKFKPGATVRVKIDAGVKDDLGQEAPAFDGEVQLDDLYPSMYVGREQALLEASGDGMLPVQVTNLRSIEADLWHATPAEMARIELCQREKCDFVPQRAPDAPLRPELNYPKNEPTLHGIDLRKALSARTGLVIARLRAPGTDFADHPLRVLAQITDVAVHAKIGAVSSLAWVTSVTSAKPLANARVAVFDPGGAQVAEATTDANGLAQLPGYDKLLPKREGWAAPRVLVAASVGDDTGYVTTEGWDELVPPEIGRDFDVLGSRGLGLVFADRGIYRPGDTVHLHGILRRQKAGALITPEGERVRVQVEDPDNKALLDQSPVLSRYGTFSADVVVPKEGRLGRFGVTVSDAKNVPFAYGAFTVAEYRAPQFRVDVMTPRSELTAGDELTASVVARYLFGGAMERAQAQWSVQRASESYEPPRNEGFRFGRMTWAWDENQPQQDNGVFATGQGEIGRDGALQIKAGKVEAQGDRAARFTIEAEVADVSRQRVAARTSVLVHPAQYYVGLKGAELFVKAGDELRVPTVAVAPDGKRVQTAVKLTALLRSWHSIRKRGVNGVYTNLSEPVDEKLAECELKTADEPRDCALKLPKAGFYTVRAESTDSAGHLALTTVGVYAIGGGFAAWQQSDTPRVEVVPDKTSYAVGETAHLLIKSPYASCKALISIEREGVAQARLVDLTGTAQTIDVPITEQFVPNVFVGVVLQRERVKEGGIEPGDDPGRPSMRVGYAELKVGTASKQLKVSVSVPKPEWKPREKIPVSIKVSAPAEVQLYAVDDAVLRLTAYQQPDPLEAMFPRHSLSVALGEPLTRLVRRQKFGEKGEVQPGGGGGLEAGGTGVRRDFRTTILWQTLTTDAAGNGTAEITLPDNLTTFRIFAVATAADDHFGAAQTEVRVSLPLLVLPALPRFARVGDAFEAGVVVHATAQQEVTVHAEIADGVKLEEPADKKVTVEANVAREVRFKMRATAPGAALLRFTAKSAQFSDGVQQSLPISVPAELEAVAVAGDTTSSKSEGLVPPQGVRNDLGGLELTLSSSALGGMTDGMKQLVDYPYGCLEQLSSRLVPFVAVREIKRVFGADVQLADVLGESVSDDVVPATVAKLEQLQTPGGGFLYWPTSDCPRAWPSIYATMALHRAREAGFSVDADVLKRAKRYLGEVAAGEKHCGKDEVVGDVTRIFALQVLARMGDPKPSYYDELYAQRDKLPLFAKALLADAMAVGKGKRPRAEALLQDLFDAAKETPREVHFEESDAGSYAPLWDSDTRTTGMALQTLVDLKPQHPYVSKIARYLVDVRKGGAYRNTQEAAYALMGLTEVVRVKERTAPDFVAKATLGGAEVMSAEFRKRSLEVKHKTLRMSELPQKGQLPLTFSVDGQGSLYYSALLKYAPAQMPTTARNEGIFVQRWFEPFDAPGKQALEFKAGDLVRVRVRVATSQERTDVAVEVPLPAGFEALDTQLATTRQIPHEQGEEGSEHEESEQLDQEGGWWSPFVYSEKRDDRVVYFSDHLPPGVHLQSFVARATTPGTFIVKPAHAGEMYAPEVFGRSEAGTVKVVAQEPLAQR